jgi:tRNA1Val (adenine37-N6)-methyltransferase
MTDKTVDELQAYGLKIIQPRNGYRFSVDPLLLCDFAGIREAEEVVDLGTGCGVIPLILARKAREATMTGIEIQKEMAVLAGRNVRLNALADRIAIVNADVADIKKHFTASSFDLVVANPPYRKRGTGRISPKPGRDDARHESTDVSASSTTLRALPSYWPRRQPSSSRRFRSAWCTETGTQKRACS